MKKFLALCLMAFALVSCDGKRDYTAYITYKIYYPGNTVIRHYSYESTADPRYTLSSDRGSNWLYVSSSGNMFAKTVKLEDTTAPIEVVSFIKEKNKH